MKSIILTVQSNGSNGYRLGINTEDSRNIFKCRKKEVHLLLLPEKCKIVCFTACGNPCDNNGNWLNINVKTGLPFNKKGYDLNKKQLSCWIKKNGFDSKREGKSKRLKFNLLIKGGVFYLVFISEAS